MSFLKSALLGSEGSYNIFGIQAKFEKEVPSFYPSSDLQGAGFVSKAATQCINSNVFRWLTQGYAHTFIHEMSHALTFKLLTNQDATVRVFKSSCTGETDYPYSLNNLPDWKKNIIYIAGPMGDIAFSTCKLIAATALKNYLSWPIALALGSGAVIWISGELLYAYTSLLNKDAGDFGIIARSGNISLALASTTLVSQVALGVFAAIKFAV